MTPRGADENQWATMARESAFIEVIAPTVRSRGESPPKARSPLSGTPAQELRRGDDGVLRLFSRPDYKVTVDQGEDRNELGDEVAIIACDWVFDSIAGNLPFVFSSISKDPL
jgi:hypothetical protein